MSQLEDGDYYEQEDSEIEIQSIQPLQKKDSASMKRSVVSCSTSVEDIEAGLNYLRRLNEYYDAKSM